MIVLKNAINSMDYILTILAAIGIILFIFGYLGFVIAGFKHHFVTGIISAFPILNIVTVPALWHKVSRKLIISTIGLIIVVASWFLGANTGIQEVIKIVKGDKASVSKSIKITPSTSSKKIAETGTTISPATSEIIKPYANQQRIVDESNMQELPQKALYKMHFESIPLDKLQSLKDRIVQVITNNNEQLEGRVLNITASSLLLQTGNTLENELPIANIKKISLMVKKAN